MHEAFASFYPPRGVARSRPSWPRSGGPPRGPAQPVGVARLSEEPRPAAKRQAGAEITGCPIKGPKLPTYHRGRFPGCKVGDGEVTNHGTV